MEEGREKEEEREEGVEGNVKREMVEEKLYADEKLR